MIILDPTDRPAAPTAAIRERWETQARYRRLLSDKHQDDVLRELAERLDPVRKRAQGKPVLGTNLFKSTFKTIGTACYDLPPEVGHPDSTAIEPFLQALEKAGLWALMQTFGVDLVGVGDHGLRVEWGNDTGLSFRPVDADTLICLGHPATPDKPHTVIELQEREYQPDGEPVKAVWVYEILSIKDPNAPVHRIVLADSKAFAEDATDLSGYYKLPGNYQYIDSSKKPFLPFVLYHTVKRAKMWGETENLALARGSLEVSVLESFHFHGCVNASWPQRNVAGLEPRNVATKNTGTKSQVQVAVMDPASVGMWDVAENEGGNTPVMQWQWGPGADVLSTDEVVTRYIARLGAQFGLGNGQAMRTQSGDARSGYAISIERDELRALMRKIRVQLRRGDLETLYVSAALANLATRNTKNPTNYPETGFTIDYPAIPKSAEEREAELDDIERELSLGLMSRVQAYQRRHGCTEEQAREALRQIDMDRREFPTINQRTTT